MARSTVDVLAQESSHVAQESLHDRHLDVQLCGVRAATIVLMTRSARLRASMFSWMGGLPADGSRPWPWPGGRLSPNSVSPRSSHELHSRLTAFKRYLWMEWGGVAGVLAANECTLGDLSRSLFAVLSRRLAHVSIGSESKSLCEDIQCCVRTCFDVV